jgi:hypothetical protein
MSDPTTSVETGVETTARRRRPHIPTPQEMLASFRRQHPDADAVELRRIAQQHIAERAEFEDIATKNFAMWCIEGHLARAIKDEPSPEEAAAKAAERNAQKEQLAAAIARADAERIDAIVTIRLLEYETPYGKKLGDCTGAECERLSRRYGSFFAELSKRITRSEMVRAHLTESELQAIATTHRLIGEKATR